MGLISTNISNAEIERLRTMRWRCRYDLLYLCNEVLGFNDVNEKVHKPILDAMQKFLKPTYRESLKIDIIEPGRILYEPWNNPYNLPGKRRLLLLDPRGFLKTTINCTAHVIQWILNYPEITLIVFQSTSEKVKDIIRGIKEHFQYNAVFRALFPDYVPQKSIRDWGNKSEFFCPTEEERARRLQKYLKSPQHKDFLHSTKDATVTGISIDEGTSGRHIDVIKASDLVETNNSKTEMQLSDVIYNFRMAEKLLVKSNGWIDVEGTRYHFADLYGDLITKYVGDESIKPAVTDQYRKQWKVSIRGCYKKNYSLMGPNYTPQYTPEEMELPEELTDKGEYISIWPERYPVEELEQERGTDPLIFSMQRLNDPSDPTGKTLFPLDQGLYIAREDFRKIPIYEHTVTVDTAEKTGEKNDYSVICVCAWDGDGRCYLHDVRVGKYEPSELLDHLFDVNTRYKPSKILIEEVGYVIGLKIEIQRRQDMKGIFLPIEFIRKTKTMNKKDRIKNTLQPVWQNKRISVVKFDKKDELQKRYPFHFLFERQCKQFPKAHDDILDALTDQFHGRTWFGKNIARPDGNDYYKNSDGTFTEAGVNYLLNEGTKAFPTIQDKLMQQFLYPDPETLNGKVVGNWITGLL